MVLGEKQRLQLTRVLSDGLGFGRTRMEMTETGRGRGFVVVLRESYDGAAGSYVATQQIKIGAGGAVTRNSL